MENNILFETHLQYHIDTTNLSNNDESLTKADVESINLHKCTFADFRTAVLYVRSQNPDMFFLEATLETIKPAGYLKAKEYDFVELTDYAKHTVITVGNMALFSELQKVANAIDFFLEEITTVPKKTASVAEFDDYNNYDIKSQPVLSEELGSCVISGGSQSPIRVTANLHASSTAERPIIKVNYYSLISGVTLENVDIIDLTNIYMENASMVEAFAYMSYNDYMHNVYNKSFDKLLFSTAVDVDTVDDFYSKHCDLKVFV